MNKKIDLRESVKSAKFIKDSLHKLVYDLPSEKYHGLIGSWSSSQLKDMIDDEDYFIKKHVKRQIPKVDDDSFGTGNYFHTMVLEPHKAKSEIVVFDGKVRYGKAWDKFKATHAGKTIITSKQKEVGDKLVEAVCQSTIAKQYLVGDPEVSLFTELSVLDGKIYAPKFNKVLTRKGWVDTKDKTKGGYPFIVKVRADTLGDGFVSDLKSTSGNAKSFGSVRGSISKYKYDLSASLYVDMFNLVRPKVTGFYWIFASKDSFNVATWEATEEQILVGRAKYMKAIIRIADCAQNNWEVIDYLRQAHPLPHELEWLIEKDTDLL